MAQSRLDMVNSPKSRIVQADVEVSIECEFERERGRAQMRERIARAGSVVALLPVPADEIW